MVDKIKLPVNKKNLKKIFLNNDIKTLDNEYLLECFFVSKASIYSEKLTCSLFDEIMRREICFSKFYNFAKYKLSKSYLIMLSTNTPEITNSFVKEFNDMNPQYSENSAPKQKGKIVSRLYAIYYKINTFKDISLDDSEKFYNLILSEFENFKGDRSEVDNDLTRNDLYGLVLFVKNIYEFNGVDVPSDYLDKIIPKHLIKYKGLNISRGKVKTLHNNSNIDKYEFISNIYKSYIDTLFLKTQKEQFSATLKFLEFINEVVEINEIKNIEEFEKFLIILKNREHKLLDFFEKKDIKNIRLKATFLQDMFNWFLNKNDLLSKFGTEILFSNYEWDLIRRNKFKNISYKKDETPKEVIPMRVTQLAIEILCDPEYKWSRKIKCQYFLSTNNIKIFNPTLTNILALIFLIPIRMIQAQVLDSGEGDQYQYDFEKKYWIENNGQHAGYWKVLNSINTDRGFLKRDQSLVEIAKKNNPKDLRVTQAFMYINTNKTADRSVGYSDVSGYTIPWHHEPAFEIYARQKEFIVKHHPINRPSSLKNLKTPQSILGGKPTKSMLNIIPDRFYLFRCNLNRFSEHKNLPPTKNLITQMWNNLMIEIQRRLDEEGADFSIISNDKYIKFSNNIGGRNSYISYLTPHCTRVTGITRLEEHGVPIDIISKLIAGHANIKTTYHYVKHDVSYSAQKITEAQNKINEKLELSIAEDLRNADVDSASKIAYIPEIYKDSWDLVCKRSWNSNLLGICPNSGTLCEEGHINSDIIFKGAGKCLNCKFLISGKPYLINIWSHINALLYRAKELNNEYTELQKNYKESIKDRYLEYQSNNHSKLWKEINLKIQKLENHMEINSEDLNIILTEVYFANHLFEIVRELTNNNEDFVEGLTFHEVSNFEHLNSIVESESYLPYFQRNKDLKFKRDTIVDHYLMAIDEKPIFLRGLTESEKEKTLRSISKMIEEKIKNEEFKYIGSNQSLNELLEII